MHTQIITITATGGAKEQCDTLCTECAAICNRIAGVQATEWQVNRATGIIAGIMRWSEYETIAMGTETTELLVARVSLAAVQAARASGGSGARLSCPVCARE